MLVGIARPRVLSCSACIAAAVTGPPQRGLVHSVFKSAANIVFPDDFVLSLNTSASPRMPNGIQLATGPGTMPFSHLQVGMPVLLGVQRLCIQPLDYVLDLSHAAQWHPFIERPATLDTRIVQKNCAWLKYYVLEGDGRPPVYDGRPRGFLTENDGLITGEREDGRPQGFLTGEREDGRPQGFLTGEREDGRPQGFLTGEREDGRPQGAPPHNHPTPVPTISVQKRHRCIVGTGVGWLWGGAPCGRPSTQVVEIARLLYGRSSTQVVEIARLLYGRSSSQVVEMARSLCGCGVGLTPTGDDILAGWMAIGWLLKGPQPDFLADCQHIVAIARRQTHLLSQCWLDHAAHGYVAEPVGALLLALTQEDHAQLAQTAQAVLAMGATSGFDVIQGMLMAMGEL